METQQWLMVSITSSTEGSYCNTGCLLYFAKAYVGWEVSVTGGTSGD